MYAKAMTTRDIRNNIRELYNIKIFNITISRIANKILPLAKE